MTLLVNPSTLMGRPGRRTRPAPVTTFSDGFDRPDEDLEASPDWTRVDGTAGRLAIRSNRLAVSATGSDTAYLCPDLGSADHYSRCAMLASFAGTSPFLACRVVDANNFIGVRANSVNAFEVFKRVGGTLTGLGAFGSYSSGVVVELQVVGDTARLLVDGVEVLAPAPLSGSLAGVTRQGLVARSTADPWIDSFEAGIL